MTSKIEDVSLYGGDSWPVTKSDESSVNYRMETRMLHRSFRVFPLPMTCGRISHPGENAEEAAAMPTTSPLMTGASVEDQDNNGKAHYPLLRRTPSLTRTWHLTV